MEQNKIYDRELKENLANYAISILLENNLITKDDFSSVTFEFGYLFQTETDEIEALYSMIIADKFFPFACQKGKIMYLTISKEQYDETVENMKSMHPCLNSVEIPETPAQKKRREKNNKILKKKGITCHEKMVSSYEDSEASLKSVEEICKRALACIITVQIACDIQNGSYEESMEFFRPYYQKFGVEDCLNEKEKRILDGTYDQQDVIDMGWSYEAYWALCWSLGLIRDISDASSICDCDKAISFLTRADSLAGFAKKCKLRKVKEILDMQDLYFRYNWAINQAKVSAETSLGDLNTSVVIERRRGLEWILSSVDDWNELAMNA